MTFVSPEIAERFKWGEDYRMQVPLRMVKSSANRNEDIELDDIVPLLSPYGGPVSDPPSEIVSVAEELAESSNEEFLEVCVRRCTVEGNLVE